MPRDDGRIVLITDFGPKKLLRIAEQIAVDSECSIDDLRGEDRDGFHLTEAKGDPPIYTIGTILASAAGGLRITMDIEIFADRTKKGDGRIYLDWVETGSSLRPSVCRNFAQSIADELETRIEDEGGEIYESYDK